MGEKEEVVVREGRAQGSAERVEAELRFFHRIKEIAGVQFVISKVVKGRAVESVRSGLGNQSDLSASAGAVFGGVSVGLDAKFLNVLEAGLDPEGRIELRLKPPGGPADGGEPLHAQ